jgi:hypothetical protein
LLVFIVSLPFVFLLARTLFGSSLAGWITVSIYSISPFIQLQAQEARYHILWVLFSIMSNYFFLEAVKRNKTACWIGYVIASVLNLYTSAISGLLLLSHFIYIMLFKKELTLRYIFFTFLIMLAYSPWMYFMVSVHEKLQNRLAWQSYFHSSFFTLDLLFFQLLGFVKSFSFLYSGETYFFGFIGITAPILYVALLLDLIVLGFIIYAIIYLFKKNSKEEKWFFVLIMLPFILLFYLYDVIRNGFASTIWQYQIVNMVGIIFIVGNLLTKKIHQGQKLYKVLFFSLVLLSVTSIFIMSKNKCWVTAPECKCNVETAQMVRTPHIH